MFELLTIDYMRWLLLAIISQLKEMALLSYDPRHLMLKSIHITLHQILSCYKI